MSSDATGGRDNHAIIRIYNYVTIVDHGSFVKKYGFSLSFVDYILKVNKKTLLCVFVFFCNFLRRNEMV